MKDSYHHKANLAVKLKEASISLDIVSGHLRDLECRNIKYKLNEKEKKLCLKSEKLSRYYWELADELEGKYTMCEIKFSYTRLVIENIRYAKDLIECQYFGPLVRKLLPESFVRKLKNLAEQTWKIEENF